MFFCRIHKEMAQYIGNKETCLALAISSSFLHAGFRPGYLLFFIVHLCGFHNNNYCKLADNNGKLADNCGKAISY